MAACFLWLALISGLAAHCLGQGTTTGNMPYLGFPEPYWYPITQGNAAAPAIVPKPLIQVFGDVVPYTNGSTVCKWFAPPVGSPPTNRGTCKTDISWITASAGLKKSVFDDPVVNYILRFQLQGACYRSTQVRDNKGQLLLLVPVVFLQPGDMHVSRVIHMCLKIKQRVPDMFLSGSSKVCRYAPRYQARHMSFGHMPQCVSLPPIAAPLGTATLTLSHTLTRGGTVS
jgi:hypothetical protein